MGPFGGVSTLTVKRGVLLLVAGATFALAACSKKEDAPPPNYPHVSGMWTGNGTDDAIGYFNAGIDMTQSAESAAGTFTLAGSVATIKGNVAIAFGQVSQTNMNSFTLTRTTWTVADPANANRVCAATLTLVPHTGQISNTYMAAHYTMTDCQGGTWQGGLNLTKMARTN